MKCLQVSADTGAWTVNECEDDKLFLCETELEGDQLDLDHQELVFWSNQQVGYVQFKSKLIDHKDGYNNEINIEFSTSERDGLLLWQGEDSYMPNTFMAVTIEDGRVAVNVANNKVIVLGVDVSDGDKHKATIMKTRDNIELTIDDTYSQSTELSGVESRDLSRYDVFLGGAPDNAVLFKDAPRLFQECFIQVTSYIYGHG